MNTVKNVQGLLHLRPNVVLNKQGLFYYGWMWANKLVHKTRIMIGTWNVLHDEYCEKCARIVALAPKYGVKYYGWIRADKVVFEIGIRLGTWNVLQDEYNEKCSRAIALVSKCTVK